MGNRAVITASTFMNVKDCNDIGVYLHWNGGRDSVEAFLTYCKLQGFRSPDKDAYGYARLVQVIANYFGPGGLSVGLERCCKLDCDNWDNGVYVIRDWEIVNRKYFDGRAEKQNYNLVDMLLDIDECQPKSMQLGEKFITAPTVSTDELKPGDIVYVRHYNGEHTVGEVVGIGEDKFVNGRNVLGVPYVDIYGDWEDYSANINNYLFDSEYRIGVEVKE